MVVFLWHPENLSSNREIFVTRAYIKPFRSSLNRMSDLTHSDTSDTTGICDINDIKFMA